MRHRSELALSKCHRSLALGSKPAIGLGQLWRLYITAAQFFAD